MSLPLEDLALKSQEEEKMPEMMREGSANGADKKMDISGCIIPVGRCRCYNDDQILFCQKVSGSIKRLFAQYIYVQNAHWRRAKCVM